MQKLDRQSRPLKCLLPGGIKVRYVDQRQRVISHAVIRARLLPAAVRLSCCATKNALDSAHSSLITMQVSFTQQQQAHKRPASRQSPAAPKAVARQQQLVTPAKCHQQSAASDQQLAGASVQQPNLLQRQQPCSSNGVSSSRRGMLGMLGAAAAMALVAAPVQPAAAAAAVNSGSALEEYMKLEDAGKLKDQRSLENIRWVAVHSNM